MARSYTVDEAKEKLGEILRQVKRGGSVTISERGREVARVVPITVPKTIESRLEELERTGQLTAAPETGT